MNTRSRATNKQNRSRSSDVQNRSHSTDLQTPSHATDIQTPARKLLKAINNNDVNLVTSLLRQGADVNTTNPETNQPILLTAMSESIDVAKLLLSYGADVNVGCSEYSSPLHFAIRKLRSTEIVRILLEAGADANHIDTGWKSASPLYAAAGIGVTRITESLLSHGADVNLVSTYRAPHTALCRAAECGFVPVAELLLRHGADVTLHEPLWYALLNERCSAVMVELLLKHGADVNATRNNRPLLVEANDRLQPNTAYFRSPLLVHASSWNTYGVNRVMIDHGANVNIDVPGRRNVVLVNVVDRLMHAPWDEHKSAHHNRGWLDVLQQVVVRCDSYECGVIKPETVAQGYYGNVPTRFSWGEEPRGILLLCLIEVVDTPKQLRCCRMLLRHGVTEKFRDIFEVVYNFFCTACRSGYSKMLAGDVCSASFLRLMIVAGVDFSNRQHVLVLIRGNVLFDTYLDMLDKELKRPRSLKDYCVMTVRKTLPKTHLWRNIDSLPLPELVKDALKLTSL